MSQLHLRIINAEDGWREAKDNHSLPFSNE
jgi:hypothetical protein